MASLSNGGMGLLRGQSRSTALLWLRHLMITRLGFLSMRLLWHARAGGEYGSRLIARGGYHGHMRLCNLLAELPVQA